MRLLTLFLLLILSSCATTNSGVSSIIIAKCVSNDGTTAVFESKQPGYAEIVVKDKAKKYEVGRSYALELRKK